MSSRERVNFKLSLRSKDGYKVVKSKEIMCSVPFGTELFTAMESALNELKRAINESQKNKK